ncbi:MAG: Ribonuclease HII [Parcubacteria group bacterium GW2011_GWA2_40_8]|nr:MAG: Ribonuclease HII [Parcubacteria group bacterium GW2011_GWB1_40_14]KKR78730.1 MAG: Ribonuclease HII [Parcubacteria group bacterium GW2011_GWA2_40_8]
MKSKSFVVGIDEVGRGPLAGPITVAAFGMPANIYGHQKTLLKGIRDSKRLSAKQREQWYLTLAKNGSFTWATASVDQKIIDKRGIAVAARLAVALAIKRLTNKYKKHVQIKFEMIYLDGSLYAPDNFNQKTVIKGDEKIPIISAASIMAKVTRDRLMVKYSLMWPKYGFDRHKGYGTRAHYSAIKKFGLLRIHRKSFIK